MNASTTWSSNGAGSEERRKLENCERAELTVGSLTSAERAHEVWPTLDRNFARYAAPIESSEYRGDVHNR